MQDFKNIITIEPGKRSGQATIRGMRITVTDVLNRLASGMTVSEILTDFDELSENDIYAVLSFAANKESRIYYTAV